MAALARIEALEKDERSRGVTDWATESLHRRVGFLDERGDDRELQRDPLRYDFSWENHQGAQSADDT